jgi:hypothetical protein
VFDLLVDHGDILVGIAYKDVGFVSLVGLERRDGGNIQEMVAPGEHDTRKVPHRDPVRASLEPGGVENGKLPTIEMNLNMFQGEGAGAFTVLMQIDFQLKKT